MYSRGTPSVVGFKMFKFRSVGLLAGVGLLFIGGGTFWYFGATQSSAPQFRTAKVERGPMTAAVSSSGSLAAVVTVQVGSQISGQIKELNVDFNSEVSAGDLIARIDPDSFIAKLNQANANLDVARANLAMQQAQLDRYKSDVAQASANIVAAKANTAKSEVAALDAKRDLDRKLPLVERGAISASDRDKAQALLDTAVASVNASKAQERSIEAALQSARSNISVGEAQVLNAEATVRQNEAAVRQAQIDLDRTEIRAPVSGTVILRSIDKGQTVAASLAAPVLFTIAENLRHMQVETSVDEADVGRIREGLKATFSVDAFPGRTYEALVKQVRKASTVASNVVTYTVVLSAENPDLRLLPGMTANVRIITDERSSALKIPNAALRFRPPGFVEPARQSAAAPAARGAPPADTGPGTGSSAARQIRDRLISELKPEPSQVTQIDSIFADSATKIRAVFTETQDEAERRRRLQAVRAESSARIVEILNPEQKKRYAEILAEQSGGRQSATQGRVFVLGPDGQPKSIQLRLGINDGTATELLSGDLAEGAEVVTGGGGANSAGPASTPRGPGGPGMRL